MNVQELVVRGREETVALCCGNCGRVYAAQQREFAVVCCDAKCTGCGKKLEHLYRTLCLECQRAAYEKRQETQFAAAQKMSIEEVFKARPGMPLFYDEEWYDEDTIHELVEANDGELPEYLWASQPTTMDHVDASDIIEQFCSPLWDEAPEQITAEQEKELQQALDSWREKNDLAGWETDYGLAVVPTEEERNGYRAEWKKDQEAAS